MLVEPDVGGQMSEVRRQRTEGRGQITEDRGQMLGLRTLGYDPTSRAEFSKELKAQSLSADGGLKV